MRGGCYKAVLEPGSPLRLDGRNVFVMYTCWLHMCSLFLWSMCLFFMHGGGHYCSCVAMWKMMVIVVGSGRHECTSVMHLLCMSVSICHYACISIVMV